MIIYRVGEIEELYPQRKTAFKYLPSLQGYTHKTKFLKHFLEGTVATSFLCPEAAQS